MTTTPKPSAVLSAKDRAWLEAASLGAGSGLYPGERWEFAPKRFASLEKRGLVRAVYPHNPVHKLRAVITEAGRQALESTNERK